VCVLMLAVLRFADLMLMLVVIMLALFMLAVLMITVLTLALRALDDLTFADQHCDRDPSVSTAASTAVSSSRAWLALWRCW
jgi:hypothetical protein